MERAIGAAHRRVAAERLNTRQAFIQDHAQREQVGTAVGDILQEQFGRHVAGRSGPAVHGGGGLGDFGIVGGRHAPGHAEIEQLYVAADADHNVLRLDVAVNDAFFMGGVQRVGALADDGKQFGGRHLLRQPGAQRDALDILHHDEDVAFVLKHVVDAGESGVAEHGGALCLSRHALRGAGIVRQARPDALQRDAALQRRVFRGVHLAHAA